MSSASKRLDDLEQVTKIKNKPILVICWSDDIGYYKPTDETKIDYRALIGAPELITRLTQAEVDQLEQDYSLQVIEWTTEGFWNDNN